MASLVPSMVTSNGRFSRCGKVRTSPTARPRTWLGPALDDVHLKRYAQELGLDLERFEREMREHVHLGRVREDFESGVASGVSDTPAFFINGVRYEGEADLDSLLAAIESAGTSNHGYSAIN